MMKTFFLYLLAVPFISVMLSSATTAQASKCGESDHNCKIAEYTKQIALNRNDVEAYYNRGLAFQGGGRNDEAILDFTKYIGLKPAKIEYLADGYNSRGICYKRSNKFDLAIADYTSAIQLMPAKAIFYYNRGNSYSARKSFEPAVADFSTAIGLKADYSGAYVGRGHAYMNKGDDDAAFADFTKAIAIDPNESEAYYNRAVIQNKRKAYQKAVTDYDRYISLNTNNIPYLSDGYQNRGIAYYHLGNLAQAVKDLSLAIDLDPNDPSPYRSRAVVYRDQGKTALAEADEKKAASLVK